jgi:hypothetical protein
MRVRACKLYLLLCIGGSDAWEVSDLAFELLGGRVLRALFLEVPKTLSPARILSRVFGSALRFGQVFAGQRVGAFLQHVVGFAVAGKVGEEIG